MIADNESTAGSPTPATPADDVTLTLAGTEIPAWGGRVLRELRAVCEIAASNTALYWHEHDGDDTDELGVWIDQIRALSDGENGDDGTVTITISSPTLRRMLLDGITAARETLSHVLDGEINAEAGARMEWECAARDLSALLSMLERAGWLGVDEAQRLELEWIASIVDGLQAP